VTSAAGQDVCDVFSSSRSGEPPGRADGVFDRLGESRICTSAELEVGGAAFQEPMTAQRLCSVPVHHFVLICMHGASHGHACLSNVAQLCCIDQTRGPTQWLLIAEIAITPYSDEHRPRSPDGEEQLRALYVLHTRRRLAGLPCPPPTRCTASTTSLSHMLA
jgi:hypothetical protein